MGDEIRITVIATGFGDRATDERAPRRPGAGNDRATDGRPVKRLGLLVEDELDVPAFQRRGGKETAAAAPPAGRNGRGAHPVKGAENGEDDYDIPTFLRRGAD